MPSNQCPEECSCSDTEEYRLLVNCSVLGLKNLPSHPGFEQFLETSASEVEIDLSRNEIIQAHFPPSLKRVSGIDLSYNEIGVMKNVEISALQSLKKLDLSQNKKLEKMSKDVRSESLEVLTVSGCSVNEVEEGFLQQFPALRSLDLSCNSLTELTALFPSGPKDLVDAGKSVHRHLTLLNVSHNEIYTMHEKGLIGTRIRVLDVSNNNVAHFRFTLYLQHLEELYASNNKLKNLDGIALPNAVLLDVSKNELRDVRRLNLIGNELTGLRYEILHNANNLEFLLLAENPWNCDCESEEFRALHRLVLSERSYSDGDDLHCHNESVFPWSEACSGVGAPNDDLVLSSRAAFYAVIYLFSALFGILIAAACYRCIQNLRQSDAVVFTNDRTAVNDREEILVDNRDMSDIPYIDDPPPDLQSVRRSTPPPNYDVAVRLPALTEEQRETALSTLSLQKIT
ncbi:UNVERIFIED_CONTAM: hypothetical protein PYX00_007881 [Menopon gallinae]|uniref:Uncharacterized protein n=1 Tax=Menopon gallinae TaxID=328185 RepID=A0AAW2HLI5_9NEOP